jgi:3-(3-hydroxy-phenyl)propionate hydroxylase
VPYEYPAYPFVPPPELKAGRSHRVPVVIAGGGPIGLTMALELARQGVRSIVLEEDNSLSEGSRAICWSKRTLEILDRLGVGERLLAKGFTWNQGKVFFGDDPEPVYSFDLLSEKGHKFPAFINLQQYFVEQYLVDALNSEELTEVRWRNKVVDVRPGADGVAISVDTPAGRYELDCAYLLAADGCHSDIRNMFDLEFVGETFKDHFLIADIRMQGEFPAERRFWFDPPFNRGQSALLHQQADDVFRLDFQLGWDIDREEECKPEKVSRRIRAMLGEDVEFDFDWVSVYTFQCRRLKRFVHGRIIYIGDSAHLVSPFGARGANSGIQDVDNLGWKLALVLNGEASSELLETYNSERVEAARENLLQSTRSIDFMTPKSAVSRAFRDAVLELARDHEFARSFVNSGRLSTPKVLADSPLNTPDQENFAGGMVPGAPCADAPVSAERGGSWLLEHLGNRFLMLYFTGAGEPVPELDRTAPPIEALVVTQGPADSPAPVIVDFQGLVRERYYARPGSGSRISNAPLAGPRCLRHGLGSIRSGS